ncbi:MAG: alpha/beta fold hydrolase [Woeseiaceae bacterium]
MKTVLLLLVVLIAALLVLRIAYPQQFANRLLLIARRVLGLRTRSIDVDGNLWPYLEGGPASGEVLLLLHGFAGNKDNWLLYALKLRREYRVIIPDLPGFGDNGKDPGADYGMAAQVENVRRFVDALGIASLHIGGNSMGGFIALKFALTYPDKVESLALLNNAGVVGERKSELELAAERGENPLTVSSAAEFDKLLDFVMYRRIPLPGVIRQALRMVAIANQPFWDPIFWGLRDEILGQPLNDQLDRVTAPTLIIWGRHDRLIDVSCCDVLQAGIADSHCVIFEDTGHVPMLERPAESAAAHLEHLRKNPVARI